MISARGPLVVQSFSPFRIQWDPSSESSAVVDMFAGSEPTSFSVRAKADRAPPAWQVAILLLLGPELEERAGHPDALVRGQEGTYGAATGGHDGERTVVRHLRQAQAAVLRRSLDAEGPEFGEAVEDLLRDPAFPVVPVAVDVFDREGFELRDELGGACLLVRVGLRVRVNEAEFETSFEEGLGEAVLLPRLLAGVFRYFA